MVGKTTLVSEADDCYLSDGGQDGHGGLAQIGNSASTRDATGGHGGDGGNSITGTGGVGGGGGNAFTLGTGQSTHGSPGNHGTP